MQDSLLQHLSRHAARMPDLPAFIFVDEREQEASRMTFKELEGLSDSAAGYLTHHGMRGQQVLLPCEDPAQFIPLFLGCLKAGAVAVPVQPPRAYRALGTLSGIFRDA